MECYDPELDQLNYCAGLINSRCKSGCVTANGHINFILLVVKVEVLRT